MLRHGVHVMFSEFERVKCGSYLEDLYFSNIFIRANDKHIYRVKNVSEFKRRDKSIEKF